MKANSVNNGTGFNLLINGTSCSEKIKQEIDIQSLEPRRDFDRQQPTKKRKLKNDGRKEKRQKLDSNKKGREMRQEFMDED